MAPKTIEGRQALRIQWLRNRWEFARRNPEVKAAYTKALELRQQANRSPEEVSFKAGNFIHYPYLDTPEGKKEKELCEALWLPFACMIDPDKSLDDLMSGPDSMEKASFLPGVFWETFASWSQEGSHIILDIDLAKINSIDALKSEIGHFIDIVGKDLGLKDAKQRRDKDYDYILMVGDMKENQGLTYEQIAKKISPREFNPNNAKGKPESTTRNVGHLYTTYRKLVDGGYRELTYP